MHEAEEQAPCFLFSYLGFKPQTAASILLGRSLRGAGLLACPGEVTTQGPPSETQPSPLSLAFALGSPWQGPRNGPVRPPLLPSSCDDSGLHQPGREEVGLRVTPLTSSVLPCQGELTDLRMSIHMSVHPRAHQ